MSIRELLLEIRAGWPAYRAIGTTAKENIEYQRVVTQLPELLRPLCPPDSHLRVQGSTGRGNITSAPWIATFDPAITTSATQGFYVVYLFSVDLRRIYLSIAFGTTQFKKYFTVLPERHKKLRSAATHLQTLLHTDRPLLLGPHQLAATARDPNHLDYEQANIAVLEYDLENLPTDAQLEADYVYMLKVYRDLVMNPLLPETEQLFEAEVEVATGPAQPVVKLFAARPPKRRAPRGSEDTNEVFPRFQEGRRSRGAGSLRI